jgi:hypothetical protein
MFGFNDNVNDILSGLGIQPQSSSSNNIFDEFKHWLVHYVQEHNELESNHPTIKQIQNLNSVDEIEQLLAHNHEYCDECFLKMYRRFASGEQSGCGCGSEVQPQVIQIQPEM